MKCSVKGCGMDFKEILSTISTAEKSFTICPNHEVAYVIGAIGEKDIDYSGPSEGFTPGSCEACGAPNALTYSTRDNEKDIHIHLCEEHLDDLMRRDLKPEAFKRLHDKYGEIYILHDDFYTEDGYAVQPVRPKKK